MPALPPYVTALIALQFVAFGWRINREITVGDQKRKTWLPLPDYINLFCLLSVTLICIVMPLAASSWPEAERTALTAGYVLIAFHPISEAAHYRLLFRSGGRSIYTGDYPWVTVQEWFCIALSVIAAAVAGWFAFYGFPK
jgi:hypothetical protein